MKKYVYFVLGVFVLTLIPSMYYAFKQYEEERIITSYLKANHLEGLAISKNTANKVAAAVRRDFNVDEKNFKKLNLFNRPFLRESCGYLLTHREGVCGEGTRVIINLLLKMGYDATRVNLYDKWLRSVHTLVSIRIQEKEFFVDSINSSPETTIFLKENDISTRDFNVMHYSSDVQTRRGFKIESIKEEYKPFFTKYVLYSYEDIPYSKLATKLKFDIRVFNLDRPPVVISYLAEKPNLVMGILFFVLSLIIVPVLHAVGALKYLYARLEKHLP